MNIAFDAKRAFLNSSGLGNYSRNLIHALHQFHPENQYTLFTSKRKDTEFNHFVSEHPELIVHEPESFLDKKFRSRWRSYGITHQLKDIDVYHGLSNELPFNISEFKGKKIVSIHDLIFLRYPHLYPYIDRKIYNKKFRHACDVADHIIAISEESKRDIEKYYFIPESKITVLHQSCDLRFFETATQAQRAAVQAKHQLPPEYLLYVGTIEERKNLLSLIKALKLVKDIPLVVVGKKKAYYNKVNKFLEENGLRTRVHFTDNVENSELPAVYQLAKLFIFPSIFEGFGIPIIEALCSRVPVITTKGGCFSEAGGPASVYIDPENSIEMAEKINYLLNNEAKRTEMARSGFEYARRFHPSEVARHLIDLYNQSF